MNKVGYYFCSVILFSSVLAEENKPSDGIAPTVVEESKPSDDIAPTVYADISQSAIDNAVSFDGPHALLGLGLIFQQYSASVTGGNNFTSNNMSLLALTIGAGYVKTFKNNLLVEVDITSDISPKKKKEGDWRSLNADYDTVGGAYKRNKTGKLESDLMMLSLAVKAGYMLPEYKSAVYLKLGMSKTSASYTYFSKGTKVDEVDINAFVPTIGFGGERKLNNKLGVLVECNIPLKRITKKTSNGTEHRMKVGGTTIKILATYSIGDPRTDFPKDFEK